MCHRQTSVGSCAVVLVFAVLEFGCRTLPCIRKLLDHYATSSLGDSSNLTSLPGNLHTTSKGHLLQNIMCNFKGHNSVWQCQTGRPTNLSKIGNGERHMMMNHRWSIHISHKDLHRKTCVLYWFFNVKMSLCWRNPFMDLIFQNGWISNAIPPNQKKRPFLTSCLV